ncbi:MAG TPA: C25 family peptidase propeptide domain-containing protein, partial [Candidatus Syntrophosphaera sp.]|nr:C25 family peptidase propeptide domain-containing protein [Candidatus Syntrophosphaera sp.]
MNRILILFALLCALSGLTAGITVLEQSRDQLLLEFRLDQYELVRQGDFIRVSAPGLNYGSETGAPQLPWAEAKIAVPPGGSLRISVLSSSQRTEQLEFPLLPVPRMEQNEISEAFYE